MPDENEAILDAIADWGFEPEESGGDNQENPENANTNTQDSNTQDGAENESAEGSNESSTNQEKVYTEAEMKQWVATQLQNVQTQAQQKQVASEIQRLLTSDEPEDAQKLQTFIKANLEQQQVKQRVAAEVSDEYAALILPKIVTDDFMAALTPEQKARIDPTKFDNDADFYEALIDVKAEVKASQLAAAKDAEAAKAIEEANQNKLKGEQLRQPSLAAVGGNSRPDNGRESNDDLWAGFINEIGLGEDE